MASSILWARGLFIALLVIVTFLTLTPDPDDTEKGFAAARFVAAFLFGDPQLADKVAHFAAYAALGAAAFWAQIAVFARKRWAPVLLAAYGVALEGVQGLGGVRTPELTDAIANGLGALAGFGAAVVLAIIIARFRPA